MKKLKVPTNRQIPKIFNTFMCSYDALGLGNAKWAEKKKNGVWSDNMGTA